MARTASIAGRRGQGEKHQIAAGHKSVWQPAFVKGDCAVAGQRGVADLPEHGEIDQMIRAQLGAPIGKFVAQTIDDYRTALELDMVALAVIEADRLDLCEMLERPGEAGRR